MELAIAAIIAAGLVPTTAVAAFITATSITIARDERRARAKHYGKFVRRYELAGESDEAASRVQLDQAA